MRVYQFRHIRARRILAAARWHPARQPPRPFGVTLTMTRVLGLVCAARPLLPPARRRRGTRRGGPDRRREPRCRDALGAAARRAARAPPRAPPSTGSRRGSRPRCTRRIPTATIRWRYRIVMNGAAVVVPRDARRRAPVAARRPGGRRRASRTRTPRRRPPDAATAARTWSTGLANQGAGIKIGIIDDGIDQTHPYFSPAGYTMPPGYPKGQTAYTTAKVIVARAFAPAGTTWKYALQAVRPGRVGARDARRRHRRRERRARRRGSTIVSGVAPRAYIGNYKALSVPTPGVGLDGNAAEIVAAIEAAVKDGMNVINLSIGEPEVEPSRDLVARAIDARRRRGRDPRDRGRERLRGLRPRLGRVAGNGRRRDHGGRGDEPERGGRSTVAGFSSAGPTPISLRLKPDISAPGRLHPLVRPGRRGRRCRAPRWRRPRSPARRRCSASGTRTGRSRRSRRR